MKQALGLVGAEGPRAVRGTPVVPGIFTEDVPAKPRVWFCQHCGTRHEGRILASYNGAPLCLPPEDSGEANCYRRVRELGHQMPCEESPCPGDVPMEHEHGGE